MLFTIGLYLNILWVSIISVVTLGPHIAENQGGSIWYTHQLRKKCVCVFGGGGGGHYHDIIMCHKTYYPFRMKSYEKNDMGKQYLGNV